MLDLESQKKTQDSGIDYEQLAHSQETNLELQKILKNPTTNLVLKKLPIANSSTTLYCDTSTSNIRPYVTTEFRRAAFNMVHRLAHPHAGTTVKLVANRFVWPFVRRDCGRCARSCTPLAESPRTGRLEHVHIDIMGPLPPSNGNQYVVTMMHRIMRWPEAIPVSNISAESIAKVFLQNWVSRFGAPAQVTTDQGRQFEAVLFNSFISFCGSWHICTTVYHPQANGQVERWHRTLKTAIMAYSTEHWTEILPFVLFGLRSAINNETGVSLAQLTFGTHLRLLGEFFTNDNTKRYKITDAHEYVQQLSMTIRQFTGQVTSSQKSSVYIPTELSDCSHVFVRVDTPHKSLKPPYTRPHQVLERNEMTVKIEINGRISCISINRVRPAFFFAESKTIDSSKTNITDMPKAELRRMPETYQRRKPYRHVRFCGKYIK